MKSVYHPTEVWRDQGEEDSLVFWAPEHYHGCRIYLCPTVAERLRELMGETNLMMDVSFWCEGCRQWRAPKEITRRENGAIVACVHCEAKKTEAVKAVQGAKEGEHE